MIELVKNISFGLILIVGLGASALLIVWLYEWILNYIASIFKLHKEFQEFLKEKYLKRKVYTPKINEDKLRGSNERD